MIWQAQSLILSLSCSCSASGMNTSGPSVLPSCWRQRISASAPMHCPLCRSTTGWYSRNIWPLCSARSSTRREELCRG